MACAGRWNSGPEQGVRTDSALIGADHKRAMKTNSIAVLGYNIYIIFLLLENYNL